MPNSPTLLVVMAIPGDMMMMTQHEAHSMWPCLQEGLGIHTEDSTVDSTVQGIKVCVDL